MSQPLYTGASCFPGQPVSRLHMHGMKGLAAMLDIQADGIHHAEGAGNGVCDGPVVMNVCVDRSNVWPIAAEQFLAPLWMSGCDPDGKPAVMKMPGKTTAEKAGTARNHDSHAMIKAPPRDARASADAHGEAAAPLSCCPRP